MAASGSLWLASTPVTARPKPTATSCEGAVSNIIICIEIVMYNGQTVHIVISWQWPLALAAAVHEARHCTAKRLLPKRENHARDLIIPKSSMVHMKIVWPLLKPVGQGDIAGRLHGRRHLHSSATALAAVIAFRRFCCAPNKRWTALTRRTRKCHLLL